MGDRTEWRRKLGALPGAPIRVLKGIAISSSEMILAVALVVVLALAFLGILTLSFPKGTGLSDLYSDFVGRGRASVERRWSRSTADAAPFLAVVADVRRNVRDRPASAITWYEAHAGKRLEERHTVQTLARSGATISVGETGVLTLGERSLVTIKRDDERVGLRRRRTSVVLLGGRVEGKVAARGGRSSSLDVVTAAGTSAIRSSGKHDTEFSVVLHEDESSTVSIYSGQAEISTAEASLSVGPDQAVTLDPSGNPLRTDPIPETPEPIAPPDGQVRRFGAVAPQLRFVWKGSEAAGSYRFVLARDRALTDIVYAGEVGRAEFSHGNLPEGRYYWAVKAVSHRVESRLSSVRTLRLIQDLDPPRLVVELPEVVTGSEQLVIRGTTDPESELFIENRSVPLGDRGEFEYTMKLNPGMNMIVVEAIDEAGNSAYRSQYVTARLHSGGGS